MLITQLVAEPELLQEISLADAGQHGVDSDLNKGSAPDASDGDHKHHPSSSMVHCFEVTVVSCGGLPSGQEVEMELGLGPETRYIAYTFPGENSDKVSFGFVSTSRD